MRQESKEFRSSLRSSSGVKQSQHIRVADSSGRSPVHDGPFWQHMCVCVYVCVLHGEGGGVPEMKSVRLIAVDYQTQSLVGPRSSASFLANCTPSVTRSPHEC